MSERLTKAQFLVLNAAADDAENLEQLYRSITLEFSAVPQSADGSAGYWRESATPIPLSEIADAVRTLVDQGMLDVHSDPAEPVSRGDASYVWRAWFETNSQGRAALEAATAAAQSR